MTAGGSATGKTFFVADETLDVAIGELYRKSPLWKNSGYIFDVRSDADHSPVGSSTNEQSQSTSLLDELATGRTPFIVFRNLLTTKQCADFVQRLPKHMFRTGRTEEYTAFNEQLHSNVRDARQYFNQIRSMSTQLWDHVSGWSILEVIRSVLQATLGNSRKTITSSLLNGSQWYNPGVVRFQTPGHSFPLHYDSLQAVDFDLAKLRCGLAANLNTFDLPHFEVSKYNTSLSVVLKLQRSDVNLNASKDTIFYDISGKDIVSWNCSLLRELGNAQQHSIGVNLPLLRKYINEFNNISINTQEGDLIIFNSNKIHEVLPVVGTQHRITLGAFLAYDEFKDDIVVWG